MTPSEDQAEVARLEALERQAQALVREGRFEEVLDVTAQLLKLLPADAALMRTTALRMRAWALIRLGDASAVPGFGVELAVFLDRATDLATHEWVITSFFDIWRWLDEDGRHSEALAVCEAMITQLGDPEDPADREKVGAALCDAEWLLYTLGRVEEAGSMRDRLVRDFADDLLRALERSLDETEGSDTTADARRRATALFIKADVLDDLGDEDGAASALAELFERYDGNDDQFIAHKVSLAHQILTEEDADEDCAGER